jgi:hypothetical protein
LPTEGGNDCPGITFKRTTLWGSVHPIIAPKPNLAPKSRAMAKTINSIVLLLRSSTVIHAPARAPFHVDVIIYCFVRQVGTGLAGNLTMSSRDPDEDVLGTLNAPENLWAMVGQCSLGIPCGDQLASVRVRFYTNSALHTCGWHM